METTQSLYLTVHAYIQVAVASSVFFSLEMELQFQLKIIILGQKVEFYPTKCVGALDSTPIGDGNNTN